MDTHKIYQCDLCCRTFDLDKMKKVNLVKRQSVENEPEGNAYLIVCDECFLKWTVPNIAFDFEWANTPKKWVKEVLLDYLS